MLCPKCGIDLFIKKIEDGEKVMTCRNPDCLNYEKDLKGGEV